MRGKKKKITDFLNCCRETSSPQKRQTVARRAAPDWQRACSLREAFIAIVITCRSSTDKSSKQIQVQKKHHHTTTKPLDLKNKNKKLNMLLAHLLCSLFQYKLWRGQANNGRVHDSSILKIAVGYCFYEGGTWACVPHTHAEFTDTAGLNSTQRGHIAFWTFPQLLQDHVTCAAISRQRDLKTPW